jgi:hypothetical protein
VVLSVGANGVARGYSEIRREIAKWEPTNLTRLLRFAIFGLAARDPPQIGGRNPLLAFLGQEMVAHTEKRIDADIHAHFLASFADGALFQSLKIVQFAADDAPAACFGRRIAERKKDAACVVENEDADADPRT